MATVERRGRYYEATWYVWDALASRRVRRRRSTLSQRKDTAQTIADGWERDDADPAATARATATLGAALKAHAKHFDARVTSGARSEGTQHMHRVKAGHLARVLEHGGDPKAPRAPLPLATMTSAHVDAYVARRQTEGAAQGTIHKELVTLRAALKLARTRGELARAPDEIIPPGLGPGYVPRERWLPEDELRALMRELTPNRAAVAAFIVATTAEWGAVERARRGDARGDLPAAHVRGTKRKTRDRRVPVVLTWQRQLLAFALAHADGAGGMLFSRWGNVRRDIAAACVRAGIAPCTPTDLRRTACHYLQASGASERAAASMMGHTSSQMVRKVYGRLGDDEVARHLRALEQHHDAPRGATPPDFGPKAP